MATLNPATGTFDSSLNGLQGILDKIIGSKTVGTDQRSLQTQQLMDALTKGSSTENTSGTTTGSQNALQQLLSQLTGNTQQVTQSNADVGALKQVFAQQQGGITPDMLAAIFRKGAEAAPQLVATTANAVGARPGENTALATSLRDLNTNLVGQAATLNQQMLRDSADTAGRIATATGGSTTTGTTSQTTNQNSNTNTQTSQQQNIQKLLESLTSQNQNTNTQQNLRDDTTSTTGINAKQTGIAAGLAGLVSLLGSSGVGPDVINAVKGLFPTGAGGTAPGDTGLFGDGGFLGNAPTYDLPPGVGDFGANPFLTNTPGPDMTIPSDSFADFQWGFADGGIVDPAKLLSITDKVGGGGPSIAQLMALLGGGGAGAALSKKPDASTDSTAAAVEAPAAKRQDDPLPTGNPWDVYDRASGGKTVYDMQNGAALNSTVVGNFSEDFLKSIGFNGVAYDGRERIVGQTNLGQKVYGEEDPGGAGIQYKDEQGNALSADNVLLDPHASRDLGGYTAEWDKFLQDNQLTIKTSNYGEKDPYTRYRAFDKDGNAVGGEYSQQIIDEPYFQAIMLAAAAVASGGLAAAGAGAAGLTGAAASAATGAGAGFGSTYLGTDGDLNAALKGAASGGLTGGIGGANFAGMAGITDPTLQAAANNALKGGVSSAIKGEDPLVGAAKGAVGGAVKKGWAEGGVIPPQEADPLGIADGLTIRVSGGEAILPTDVVDHVGPEFIHSLIALFHTPNHESTPG